MLCERMGLDTNGVPTTARVDPRPREVFTPFELVVRETSRVRS